MTETHSHNISASETITVEDALQRWTISRNTIFKHLRTGRLESVKVDGRRLIVIASMRALLGVTRKPV
jgi:predicted site-specific integrase-resolvase